MSKKALKLDDVIEAVQDEKVIDTLVDRLFTRLAPLMEGLFSKFKKEVSAGGANRNYY